MFRSTGLSFFSKNLIFSSVNIVIVGVVLTISSYFLHGSLMVEAINNQAKGYASLALDIDDIQRSLTEPNLNSPVQKRLMQKLAYVHEKNPSVAQAYLLGEVKDDGTVLQAAVPEHLLEAGVKLGTYAPQNSHLITALRKATQTKEISTTGVYQDEYGTWISIVLPVIDKNGEVIATFGLDQDASIVAAGQKQLLYSASLVLGITLLVIIGVQTLVHRKLLAPLKDLFGAISQVSEGDPFVCEPFERNRTNRRNDWENCRPDQFVGIKCGN